MIILSIAYANPFIVTDTVMIIVAVTCVLMNHFEVLLSCSRALHRVACFSMLRSTYDMLEFATFNAVCYTLDYTIQPWRQFGEGSSITYSENN